MLLIMPATQEATQPRLGVGVSTHVCGYDLFGFYREKYTAADYIISSTATATTRCTAVTVVCAKYGFIFGGSIFSIYVTAAAEQGP